MINIFRTTLVLLVLNSSLLAFIPLELAWVNPSHVDIVWTGDAQDTYTAQEGFNYVSSNNINHFSVSTGKYAGKLGVTIKEYVQPGGLPGFNYMHVYDDISNAEARFNQGVVGYTVPATYRNYIYPLGSGTDTIGQFNYWFIALPYLGQADRVIRVHSCFSYSAGTYYKTAMVTINGI